MSREILQIIYFSGLLFAEALRLPQRIRRLKVRQQWRPAERSTQKAEWIVVTAVILGIWVLPVIYALTPGLNAFDYQLPLWASWTAAALFSVGLAIRLAAQRTLDRFWSFTLETSQNHQLVTQGIFSFTRHPIYLSLIFWAVAQPGLLHNYLAGLAGSAAVLLIWLVRVPREEMLLLEIFGDEYRIYMTRVGRLFPKAKPRLSR